MFKEQRLERRESIEIITQFLVDELPKKLQTEIETFNITQRVGVEKKSDNTDVSEVDLAVGKFLKEQLEALFPNNHFFVCEEEVGQSHEYADQKIVSFSDPLDETTNFIQHGKNFGSLVNVSRRNMNNPTDFEPIASVVILPGQKPFLYCTTATAGVVERNVQTGTEK